MAAAPLSGALPPDVQSEAAAPLPPLPRTLAHSPAPQRVRRPHASEGANSLDELARAEVLELTLFAKKKEWIEDKIRFLATLPPIDVVAPEPPAKASATQTELEQWWAEHDRIETEVDEYDMGDLARMRQFARDKSKQALSPRDTDLIEITLTTLFAIDRLLHLLRQRRKALTLLGYRLKWEEAVKTVWTAQRQILSDLPRFVAMVAWKSQAPLSASTHAHLSTTEDATLATPHSLPPSSSSRSLSHLASSTSSSSSATSASLARSQVLALQLSTLSTVSHSLMSSLLPRSAAALDRLIDSSHAPLPESFLDEQDRLESECTMAARDLPAFLEALMTQRTRAEQLERDSASMLGDLAALNSTLRPDELAHRLAQLRDESIASLRAALADLPAPVHALAPQQQATNEALRCVLDAEVRREVVGVAHAQSRLEVEERLKLVREKLDEAHKRLQDLQVQLRTMARRSDEEAHISIICSPDDDDGEEEVAGPPFDDTAMESLTADVRSALTHAHALQSEAVRVVVAARKNGLASDAIGSVRNHAEQLGGLVKAVEDAVATVELEREQQAVLEGLRRAFRAAHALRREANRTLMEEARRARWHAGATVQAPTSVTAVERCVLDDTRAAQEALLGPALARVDLLAREGRFVSLAASANDLVRTLRQRTVTDIEAFQHVLDITRAQTSAVRALEDDLGRMEKETASVAKDISILDIEYSIQEGSRLEERLDKCAGALDTLAATAWTRIPLLASKARTKSKQLAAPFDFALQDAAIRVYLNERCAKLRGMVDEVRARLREAEHQRGSSEWDAEADCAEQAVRHLQREMSGADDAAYTAIPSRLDNLSAVALPALEATLSGLLSQSCASSPRFASSHVLRQSRLDILNEGTASARETILAAQAERRSQCQTDLPATGAHFKFGNTLARGAGPMRPEGRDPNDASAPHEAVPTGSAHTHTHTQGESSSQENLTEAIAADLLAEEAEAGARGTGACSEQHDSVGPTPENVTGGPVALPVKAQPESADPSAEETTVLVAVCPSTPSPRRSSQECAGSLGVRQHGDVDDLFGNSLPFGDPFAGVSGFDEPPAIKLLRDRMKQVTAHEWLNAAGTMQLPAVADANEIDRLVDGCRDALDEIVQLPHEKLMWTDVDALKAEQQKTEAAAVRVHALARFGMRVVAADSALSDLLNAIDDQSVDLFSPFAGAPCVPRVPLSDALGIASKAVTAVRVDAIPVIDDTRVARAIERIETSWAEMLGLVEDARPRASSAASSSASGSSLRRSTRAPRSSTSLRTSVPTGSQAETLSSSISSASSSRPSSSASARSRRMSGVLGVGSRGGDAGFVVPQTPRARIGATASSRRGKSGLPVATPRRALSPVNKPTPTAAHPFSFDTPTRRDLAQSISSTPRRSLAASTRRESSSSSVWNVQSVWSPTKQRTPSASSTGSATRESMTTIRSSGGSHRASSRSSIASIRSPRLPTVPATPFPKGVNTTELYRANLQNKLDREVGSIVNALPKHVQVPIQMAEGKWTDESGMYSIGGRLYFCRILRSKQVMVRVGGGWLSLLQFIITHFGQVDGLAFSPSSSASKILSPGAPAEIDTDSTQDQLSLSMSKSISGNSLREFLASSVSSAGASELAWLAPSTPMRRSLSGHMEGSSLLRRSTTSSHSLDSADSHDVFLPTILTPRTPRMVRPTRPIGRH